MRKINLVILTFLIGTSIAFATAFYPVQSASGTSPVFTGTSTFNGDIISTGTVTAFAYYGDGSHLTGISVSTGAYVFKAGDTMTGNLTTPNLIATHGIQASTGVFTGSSFTIGISTFVVTAGKVGIGIIAPATKFHIASSETTSPRGIMSGQYNTGTEGARFHLRKARGTATSPLTVVTGDMLGRLVSSGYDGTNYLEMAGVDVNAEGTIATTRVPTRLTFWTATDATPSVLTERMRINSAGLVIMNAGLSVASSVSVGVSTTTSGVISLLVGTSTTTYITSQSGETSFFKERVLIGTTTVALSNANLTLYGNYSHSPSATQSITAAGGITITQINTNSLIRIQGNGGAIDITADPQIVAGVDGQIIILAGRDDTNTVKFDDGTGLALAGAASFTMGKGDILQLIFNVADNLWYEISRSDN